jgi:hypothetical protein
VQRLSGRLLDPARQGDPQPQHGAHGIGETIRLHRTFELCADGALDGVEGAPPNRLGGHLRPSDSFRYQESDPGYLG